MSTLELIGSSARFRTVLDQLNMVTPVESAVLIQGETGTDKEVIAQAIHGAGFAVKNDLRSIRPRVDHETARQ